MVGISFSRAFGVLVNPYLTKFGNIELYRHEHRGWSFRHNILGHATRYGGIWWWKTGHRVESMVFGFAAFAQKSAVALSALILGVLLDVIGYQAGIMQSEETLSGLRMIIVFVPLAGVVTSVACIYFYRYRHNAIPILLPNCSRRLSK